MLKARKSDKQNTFKTNVYEYKFGAHFANDWSDGSLSPIALGVCQLLTYDYWVKKPVNSNEPIV